MPSPIEDTSRRRIGRLESVAPDRFVVRLDLEAPQNTALNSGTLQRFPKINSYLTVPTEGGTVVGVVTRVDVERSPYPKRRGLKDFNLVDLPFPHRHLNLVPMGTLNRSGKRLDGNAYSLQRGVYSFPSVGDPVTIPSDSQLDSLLGVGQSEPSITIGTSPVASDRKISINPNKLFGRHLAILGNTGSGKSCTVAGLVRWSIERKSRDGGPSSFARFLILDPNGEYAESVKDLDSNVDIYRVGVDEEDEANELKLPAWMWNLREWNAFARASPGTQQPVLQQTLRELRAGSIGTTEPESKVISVVQGSARWLDNLAKGSTEDREGFPEEKDNGQRLEALRDNCDWLLSEVEEGSPLHSRIEELRNETDELIDERSEVSGDKRYFEPLRVSDLESLRDSARRVLDEIDEFDGSGAVNEDAPIEFDVEDIPDHLHYVASQFSGGSLSQWIGTLSMRIQMLMNDPRMRKVVRPDDPPSLEEFLEHIVGTGEEDSSDIVIFDLSLVPTDIIHILVAVLSRLIFEAIQRYRRSTNNPLPISLILDEAHTFVHGHRFDGDERETPQDLCRQTFERIAREGRKFGLGLVIASQRPAELSQTILSQCNTFLLHRLVNDRDQRLVRKLVPEALGDLLRDLQSLPTRQAILLGWAARIPLLVEIDHLRQEFRPRSEDPDFWAAWTEGLERSPDWGEIAATWRHDEPSESE